MAHTYDVAAVGSPIVDVLAPVDDKFLLDHNIAKGVTTLIDDHRAAQLQAALGAPREIAGGSAANTIAGLASLGGRCVFEGKVKNDRHGKLFASSMKELGVHYATPPAEDGPATAMCMIAVTPDGDRSMNTYLGAARELSIDDIDETEIAAAAVLYIEGYLWDAPKAKAACLKAIKQARQAGTKVAFTLSDPFLVGRYREEFIAILGDLDIIFANEDEAKALFEVETFDSVLQAARSSWHGIAALTRSEKGCVIAQKSDVHVVDAWPIARVVDTTGAGDLFAAGFLYALTRGRPLAQCGKLATLCAAEVISHYGARPETSLKELAAKAGLS
jgi:sugar/nucleoside kinase (ribokinase family)